MKSRGVGKLKFKLPLVFHEEKKYTLKWIFGTSHLLVGLFAALGAFVAPLYFANFFSPKLLAFLFFYLIIHLVLALDYCYNRHIDEKFLFFFYLFSVIGFVIFFIVTFIGF
jgi:hypothetical protein